MTSKRKVCWSTTVWKRTRPHFESFHIRDNGRWNWWSNGGGNDQEVYFRKERISPRKAPSSLFPQTPLSPMHLEKGQTNQRETVLWLCSATWKTAAQQQHTSWIRVTPCVCVCWSLKRQKSKVRLNCFHWSTPGRTSFHSLFCFYSDARRRVGEMRSFAGGMYIHYCLHSAEMSTYNTARSWGLHINAQPDCCAQWKSIGTAEWVDTEKERFNGRRNLIEMQLQFHVRSKYNVLLRTKCHREERMKHEWWWRRNIRKMVVFRWVQDGDRYVEMIQTVIWCLHTTSMLLLSYLCRDYLMDWQSLLSSVCCFYLSTLRRVSNRAVYIYWKAFCRRTLNYTHGF